MLFTVTGFDMSRWVLVSGGSGGIGEAVCGELANAGVSSIVGYYQARNRAEEIAKQTGGHAVQLDLSSGEMIDSTLARLAEEFEAIEGVILAASPPPPVGPFGQITEEDLRHQWQINVAGPRRLLAGLAKSFFRRHKKGVVLAVLTAAMGNETIPTTPNLGSYVIAKHGLEGVLKAAAAEYKWLHILTIYPGFIESPMLEVFDPRFLAQMRAKSSKGRFDTTIEVAQQIATSFCEAL